MNKTLVIFTNSVKHHQHCIAGKDILTNEWIRPVGDSSGCELTDEQTKYQNPHGRYLARPLQKMSIEFIEHAPLINQPENYVVSNKIWTQNYKIERDEIGNFLDNPNNLWIDGAARNDRVSFALIQNKTLIITQSLYLIKLDKIHIYWKDRSQWNQSPQRRGVFIYKNITYDLSLTDPSFAKFEEQDLLDKFVCVSLGENFNGQGYCYKIIASIF